MKHFVLALIILLALPSLSEAVKINMNILAQIESNNNAAAYNKKSGARGTFQITRIVLREYNASKGLDLTPESLFDADINREIAIWYVGRIKQYYANNGMSPTLVGILGSYNWGFGNMKKWQKGQKTMPHETIQYINKYQQIDKLYRSA
jgi:hypothetical protein